MLLVFHATAFMVQVSIWNLESWIQFIIMKKIKYENSENLSKVTHVYLRYYKVWNIGTKKWTTYQLVSQYFSILKF